ncbi:MAG: C-type lectin domain-containing protein, partial [Pseudomonadota bacterium]
SLMRTDIALILASIGLASACVQLRRLSLSEAIVASARHLCNVERVSSSSSCGQLCLREPHCAAIRYHHGLAKCDLLTARFDLLEGARALASVRGFVEVLAFLGRGFGECPATYTAGWRSSRYRWSRQKKSWSEARKACEKEGGKLAELTTEEEMKAVFDKLGIGNGIFHIGGLQSPGSQEPSGGWFF